MRTGPLPPALKAHVLGHVSGQVTNVNKTLANTTITLPTEARDTGSLEPAQWTLVNIDDTSTNQPPGSQPKDIPADLTGISGTSDLNVQMDGPPPSETDDTMVDEDWVIPTTMPTNASCDTIIQLRHNPTLGLHSLVQTSLPALLSIDEDERPDWLVTFTTHLIICV